MFFFIQPHMGPFVPFGAVLGLGPTHIDYQFWFWMYSPNFLFFIRPFLGPFFPSFGPFGVIFEVSISIRFMGPT